MRISEFFTYLFCPPKCASCGEAIGLSFLDSPLCPECQGKLQAESAAVCRRCKRPLVECLCSSEQVINGGCLFHTKLGLYHGGIREKAINGIVFEIKRSADKRLYEFLADKLCDSSAKALKRAVKMSGAKGAVITYVPRSSEAMIEYGHDQAYLLALALSERLGIPLVKIAVRGRRSDRKMKSLAYEERFAEADSSYLPSNDISSLEGIFTVIVDDVVTSGASVLAVARIALKNKARGFGVISVGISK